ncbi:mitochondrial inner membrane protein OXA1L [Hypanus sabinus]|uniref:mitochondrial inner membrane protein OXA1L n=1 Tax=Hypanus sabinus TaxID=79690 RepID=UPI0028C3CFA4|nr:mitochondrial inner membrane protein OXA1L [Hypanus sabinus]
MSKMAAATAGRTWSQRLMQRSWAQMRGVRKTAFTLTPRCVPSQYQGTCFLLTATPVRYRSTEPPSSHGLASANEIIQSTGTSTASGGVVQSAEALAHSGGVVQSAEALAHSGGVVQSTEALAPSVEMVQSASEVLQEAGLSELGLGGYTPVGLIQNILEFLHMDVGLPWWGAIVAGTVMARTMVFPVIVKGQREAAKLNNHLPAMTKLTDKMNEAKASGNKFEFAKAYSDLMMFQKKHDVNPLRGFLVPLVQAPIFISFFIALRQMAYLPVPSMQNGGLWWFPDLTLSDPFYLLPVLVTGSMWAILELGAESGVDNPNLRTMKAVFRIMPLVILPFTISFPTAVFTYWLASNTFSLLQVGFLRIPAVRHKLQIPDRIRHDPSLLPKQEGFIKSMKSGWKNAQAAQQLAERERRIKQHLDLAAKGPLRQTFTENPLQSKEVGASRVGRESERKHRPWQDTIG